MSDDEKTIKTIERLRRLRDRLSRKDSSSGLFVDAEDVKALGVLLSAYDNYDVARAKRDAVADSRPEKRTRAWIEACRKANDEAHEAWNALVEIVMGRK